MDKNDICNILYIIHNNAYNQVGSIQSYLYKNCLQYEPTQIIFQFIIKGLIINDNSCFFLTDKGLGLIKQRIDFEYEQRSKAMETISDEIDKALS